MIPDVILAIFELGLPVAALTWLLFYRLYGAGEIDRSADRKAIRSSLKRIKKDWKKRGKQGGDLVHNRWMKFGGGFYGVAALWTFIVIEATDLLTFVFDFPGFAALFEDGVLGFIISALVNQLQNFIAALLWFGHWAGDDRFLPLWILIAYLGYLLGMKLARYELPLGPNGMTGARNDTENGSE